MSKRIVLTTFGSLGDLHPYIAIALGMRARGHDVVIVTSEIYRQKVEALGIGFDVMRPNVGVWQADAELYQRLLHIRSGPKLLLRDMLMPAIRDSYDDLARASAGADLLVSHPLTFATRLVAEKLAIPWASIMLAPMGFFSMHSPPVIGGFKLTTKLRCLGPRIYGMLFSALRWSIRSWPRPWHRLRAEIGLPPTSDDPLFEGQHSPKLVLAAFSELLAAKQPDWPSQTIISGFSFYDQDGATGLPPTLSRFLDNGPPPIVFTLGSTAVRVAEKFYENSAEAAARVNRRAVLLVGRDSTSCATSTRPGILAVDYAPYSELFHRAATVVHSGGAGTTGQAMRAGRPMLVVPYGFDQPDNAERVTQLGIARTIPRHRYNANRATTALRELLENSTCLNNAAEVGKQVQRENGVRVACDALERVG
jgi:UDP:flavonoid glycosyltransferase YjiC (YdhE family)